MENNIFKEKIVIGIDHGYGNMKTRNSTFKSGVKAFGGETPVAGDVLVLNGNHYTIGENHKVYISNKNEDDDYYILTLAAIARELDARVVGTDVEVILAVGLPLHWIGQQKDDFKKYLMRNEMVEYTFCNKLYRIKICDVAVYPQGYAGIAASIKDYSGMHMLADIGNGTMNTMVIVNGKPVSDKMYTDLLGVHQCVIALRNEVQAKCGKLPDEMLIEEYLRFAVTDVSEKMMEVMRVQAEKYVATIFGRLSEYGYDPELVKLHIIGGGGCLVRNFGSYDPVRVKIIEDIRATAKGYENLYLKLGRGA